MFNACNWRLILGNILTSSIPFWELGVPLERIGSRGLVEGRKLEIEGTAHLTSWYTNGSRVPGYLFHTYGVAPLSPNSAIPGDIANHHMNVEDSG